MRYAHLDYYRHTIKIKDRTVGIWPFVDAVLRIAERINKVLKKAKVCPKGTGTYVVRKGRLVKVSDRASVGDLWIKKYALNGDKDRAEKYKSLDDAGELKNVDDRECWQEYAQRK